MPMILLVEDNPMSRDMLCRRLTRSGFEVHCAVHGSQGIELATQLRPDLILMDMSLPEIDGWEATRRLKAIPQTAFIPVIALTAHAMPGERDRAIRAGCSDFGTKPIDYPALLQMIGRYLDAASGTLPAISQPDSSGNDEQEVSHGS